MVGSVCSRAYKLTEFAQSYKNVMYLIEKPKTYLKWSKSLVFAQIDQALYKTIEFLSKYEGFTPGSSEFKLRKVRTFKRDKYLLQ